MHVGTVGNVGQAVSGPGMATDRRGLVSTSKRLAMTALALLPGLAAAQALAPANPSAAPPARVDAAGELLALGPEGQALAKRAGTWDVTFTSWAKPGADPVTVTGLVAERQIIGPMLQEILRPAPGASIPPFTRVDDLTFNRIEGRWDYMSMDTRVANGLMVAWSLDHDPGERIFVSFQPFATAGSGPDVSGRMTRMEEIITRQDADHDQKDQYFTPADGVATKWLAKRYSYTRRLPS